MSALSYRGYAHMPTSNALQQVYSRSATLIRELKIMLILTRRAGEALRIGDDIEVTVMAVNGTQVRIGIKAPRDIAVDREEIAERKRRDRENTGAINAVK